jgi:CheY-like chemotaxis protein
MTTILIAEDCVPIMEAITDRLEYHLPDAQLITCYDGWELLNHLKKSEPVDIIISDMRMPHVSGIEALETIQNAEQLSQYKEIPFILHTADAYKAKIRNLESTFSNVTVFDKDGSNAMTDYVIQLAQQN